jgi:2-succinyl-5-enolpyruvyl-6-hydroxy-3-cyclohexene-1-carboxylate synthase
MNPADVQAAFAATLVDEWHRAGVAHAVVAPGSRSTPVLAALQADGRLRLHVVIDERSAGFVALGIGAATGSPAAVVTTSGTAAVELHPAVVEAHHAGVPLLAVTADRPPELHGVGAPQTIEQDRLFPGVVRHFSAPGVPDHSGRGWWRSLAARAVAEAVAGPSGPGPVHLNLAFGEPLLAADASAARRLVPPGRPGGEPWHRAGVAAGAAGAAGSAVVGRLAGAGPRGVIVAGAGCGDPRAVAELSATMGWPVLADPRSGARLPPGPGGGRGPAVVVAAADSLLRHPLVAGWTPDVVVRLGRPWASKVMGQWLAGCDAAYQVLVDPWGGWADPDRRVDEVVACPPESLCRAVVAAAAGGPGGGPAPAADGGWAQRWAAAEAAAQAAITAALGDGAGRGELTEPAVARGVAAAVPDGSAVMMASSMPVRDVEWFAAPRGGVRFLANRGANGIDGVVSTAWGVAAGAAGAPVYALVGDLAFLYDAGALLGAGRRGANLTVVVVDNDGGGIFSFLAQAEALDPGDFEQLWGTPPGADPAAVAAAYGARVADVGDLPTLLKWVSQPPDGVTVVVARVASRAANVAVHAELNRAVAGAVSARLGAGGDV